MIMRKTIVVLFAILIICGCNNLSTQPKHLQNPELLGWVFRGCMSRSLAEQIKNDFVKRVRNKTKIVKGFENLGTLEDAVIQVFVWAPLPIGDQDGTAYSLKAYLDEYGDVVNQASWGKERAIIEREKSKAQKLFLELITAYFAEYNQIALNKFRVLNCICNDNAQCDSYTGYIVEYEVGEGYYVLLALYEYKESNRYNADIVYKGKSLHELHSHYN